MENVDLYWRDVHIHGEIPATFVAVKSSAGATRAVSWRDPTRISSH